MVPIANTCTSLRCIGISVIHGLFKRTFRDFHGRSFIFVPNNVNYRAVIFDAVGPISGHRELGS